MLEFILDFLARIGPGIVAQGIAAGVNLFTALLQNIIPITIMYVAVSTGYLIITKTSDVNPLLLPFEVFGTLELSLLTPVGVEDSFNPMRFDLAAIMDPLATVGGQTSYDQRYETYMAGCSAGDISMCDRATNLEKSIDNLDSGKNVMHQVMTWVNVLGTLLKYGVFIVLNAQIITMCWNWYNVMGISA